MNKVESLKKFFSNGKEKTITDYQQMICKFGLIYDDGAPNLYGSERVHMNKNRDELGVYQTPVQFAQLLDWLYGNMMKDEVKSYCEIGIFRGGTFLFMKHLLQSINKIVKLTAIDPTDHIHQDALPEIEPFLIKGTTDDVKGNVYDIVFIDGDHSYEWCKRDFENVGKFAKICIFHDIFEPTCPGVQKFWEEIKQTKNHVEFIETLGYHGFHQGIGILY